LIFLQLERKIIWVSGINLGFTGGGILPVRAPKDFSRTVLNNKIFENRKDLNADRKRLWFEDISSINDGKMIDSMPISLSFISKEKV